MNLSVEFIALHALLFSSTLELTGGPLTDSQGGRVAHRLFRICMLLHLQLLALPFGLPDVLHADALKVAECYGGLKGPPFFFFFGVNYCASRGAEPHVALQVCIHDWCVCRKGP
jgi:hypothetical protein